MKMRVEILGVLVRGGRRVSLLDQWLPGSDCDTGHVTVHFCSCSAFLLIRLLNMCLV